MATFFSRKIVMAMMVYQNHYYHIYNRSNAQETAFRTRENYGFFLKKYRTLTDSAIETIAYCLMPTHFHLLVRITTEEPLDVGTIVGKVLSSYTQAFNRYWKRHGSLFQQHTKAICVEDERYLLTLLAYIHNNPVRAGLVALPEEWEFSSYQDYCDLRKGTLPNKQLVNNYFSSIQDFREFSITQTEQPQFWV
jgi:putative transposase